MNSIYRWKKRILASLLMLLMTFSILTGCAPSTLSSDFGNASATTAAQELKSTAAPSAESMADSIESGSAKNAEISESTIPQVTASKKSTLKDSSKKETASKKSSSKDSAQKETKSEKSTTKQNTTKESTSEKSSSVKSSSAKSSSTKTSSAKSSSGSKSTTSGITEDGSYTSKKEVALYLHTYGHLPNNYITKSEAEALGWDSKKGNLWDIAPGKSIGGSHFGNYEKQLPDAKGRKYSECDIDYDGTYRNAKRIIYSNDGLIFYTEDHYKTFEQLY
jgi:guanyl-specific ribonuclease Sa